MHPNANVQSEKAEIKQEIQLNTCIERFVNKNSRFTHFVKSFAALDPKQRRMVANPTKISRKTVKKEIVSITICNTGALYTITSAHLSL